MPNAAVNNLILGLNIAANAQAEAEVANQRAHRADMQLLQAQLDATKKTTNADLERDLEEATNRMVGAEAMEKVLKRELAERDKALAEKDSLILEWMHSNEAFKRLARQYGKKIGVTDEQRQNDFDQNVLEIAEESPQFSNTKKAAGAKTRLSKT